jgi:hypothetical protein
MNVPHFNALVINEHEFAELKKSVTFIDKPVLFGIEVRVENSIPNDKAVMMNGNTPVGVIDIRIGGPVGDSNPS